MKIKHLRNFCPYQSPKANYDNGSASDNALTLLEQAKCKFNAMKFLLNGKIA